MWVLDAVIQFKITCLVHTREMFSHVVFFLLVNSTSILSVVNFDTYCNYTLKVDWHGV